MVSKRIVGMTTMMGLAAFINMNELQHLKFYNRRQDDNGTFAALVVLVAVLISLVRSGSPST